MIHDMIEVEKLGKPAVALVSGRFDDDAVASSRAFGMPDVQWVVVPRIYRNLPHPECARQTEEAGVRVLRRRKPPIVLRGTTVTTPFFG